MPAIRSSRERRILTVWSTIVTSGMPFLLLVAIGAAWDAGKRPDFCASTARTVVLYSARRSGSRADVRSAYSRTVHRPEVRRERRP